MSGYAWLAVIAAAPLLAGLLVAVFAPGAGPDPEPAAARCVWVSLPHATFGIITRDGQVIDAAPIARWAVGRSEREVAGYYRRRGARFADAS